MSSALTKQKNHVDLNCAGKSYEHSANAKFNFVLPSMQLDLRRTNFVSSPVTTDLVKFFLCDLVLIVVYCATISWWIKVSQCQQSWPNSLRNRIRNIMWSVSTGSEALDTDYKLLYIPKSSNWSKTLLPSSSYWWYYHPAIQANMKLPIADNNIPKCLVAEHLGQDRKSLYQTWRSPIEWYSSIFMTHHYRRWYDYTKK